jgi:phosphatidylserine/phosphatidylglycerophosphate/cardiolipin synthase-like enzyme
VDVSVRVNGKSAAGTLSSIFDRDWNGGYVTTIVPGQSYASPQTH